MDTDTDYGNKIEGPSGWTLQAFKEHLADLFKEINKGVQERFSSQEKAVATALAAQEKATYVAFSAHKESVASAFLASEKAIVKAEEAQRAYNIGHNDLSRKMDDQYKTMMPRQEAFIMNTALEAKIQSASITINHDLGASLERIGSLEKGYANIQGRFWAVTMVGWTIVLGVTIALHFLH